MKTADVTTKMRDVVMKTVGVVMKTLDAITKIEDVVMKLRDMTLMILDGITKTVTMIIPEELHMIIKVHVQVAADKSFRQ